MSLHNAIFIRAALGVAFVSGSWACILRTHSGSPPAGEGDRRAVWFDPAWSDSSSFQPGRVERATVWFDRQLIGEGDAYVRRTREQANSKRRELRRIVIDSLKAMSEASWARARPVLERLERDGVVAGCRPHWIVNGFTCEIPGGHPDRLADVPGVARVFRASRRVGGPATPSGSPISVPEAVSRPDAFSPDPAKAPWNARELGVARVWKELGLSGRGVLHVIHDFGWTFAPPPIRSTLWANPGEKPGNGIDDDGDGLVDDVHGWNFDANSADLSPTLPLLPGDVTHGDLTAAIAAGRELADTAVIVGMAPDSRWAAVVSRDIAPGVEWALDHGADTYSMSFSLPGLGEMRAHWRKVMDHAALAGLFLVSGAGNFANPQSPNFAPVPVQMRTPEDVPYSVFGVSGVGADGKRPVFSSQGPVMWKTDAYDEGEVAKPDMATVNTNILVFDSQGHRSYPTAAGWSGNSFAGPHLAGIIALMLEADPDLTPWRARDILVRTARDIGDPGFDPQTGAGLVDAYAAVQAVRKH